MKYAKTGLQAIVIGTVSSVAMLSAAHAGVNFKGKEISAIIGSHAGGGTDAMTRLVGRFMEKYLPGHPDITFRNVPGGSGIQAGNYLAEKAAKDGTVWMGGSSTTIQPTALRKKASRYDPAKFRMFGGLPAPSSIFMVRKDALARFKDKSKRPVIMGGVNGNRGASQQATWGAAYLGWNLRWVIGYSGTGAIALALQRNEVQAFTTYDNYILKPIRKSGKYVFPAQIGNWAGNHFVRRSDYSNVPTISELVKPKLKGLALEAFQDWETMVQVGKWFGLPPGVSDAVYKAYETAYLKATSDPGFKKEAVKSWSPEYTISNGHDTQALADKLADISTNALAFMETLKRKVGIPPQIPGLRRLRTKLTAVSGSSIQFKRRHKTIKKALNDKTKILVHGKNAMASDLKKGMRCEVLYPKKGAAASVRCR